MPQFVIIVEVAFIVRCEKKLKRMEHNIMKVLKHGVIQIDFWHRSQIEH